ncbi:TraX family protein [Dolosigranulum pigrum]|uniref:TraX family protein n=1 Tax=Dolosigranulum pigrum TaxID=29394 RepID=UPI001AD871C9|nr:TraX family protein [Dolosigranulum pigrum]QTJ57692.1 conjugal transfer protein TraX [Dolosigranulum pigrum]
MDTAKRFEDKRLEKIRIFNGAQLKYIAFVSMLIDHTNKAIVGPYLDGDGWLATLSTIFDVLGRVAFPIFAFLIVEGFFKTRSRARYLGSLMVFALISEVPFDMFANRRFFFTNDFNVLFTLSLALATLWAIDSLKKKLSNIHPAVWYLASIILLIISSLIAMLGGFDYEYHGILIPYAFYLFYNRPILADFFGYLAIIKEIWSLLGFGLTLTYNGKRGKQYKWVNYWFYPVHLFILGLLRFYLNI